MTTPTEFWVGEGGNAYTQRNRVDWRARIPFWKDVLDRTGARSVYEFGCNAGWNLSAIRRAYPDVQLYGYDVNHHAAWEAARALGVGFEVEAGEAPPPNFGGVDLVFTAGVLIHIPPAELEDTMRYLIGQSTRYVLAVEYAAEQETEIEYQGAMGLLWKRPYGHLYRDLGLRFIDSWDAGEGFDNCTAWLMEKP